MNETPTLGNLTVNHVMLESALPYHAFELETQECLIYALVGRIRVYANGHFLGTIGGRAVVTEPLAHVVRFPAGAWHRVTLGLEGFAADCLIVVCNAVPNTATTLPYLHWNDTFWHTVGSGTYQRTVGEVPTPPSFNISCGETWNIPGGASSWPPHANEEDLRLFAEGKTTWEEQFFVVCPSPATATLEGIYPGNKPVKQTIILNNGDIVAMPLGSHCVTGAPGAWVWYGWYYIGTALEKQYRKHSQDVQVYRK